MTWSVSIDCEALAFYKSLDAKSKKIIRAHLKKLESDPFPGSAGDKELLHLKEGIRIYRLHISHSFTAYYVIEGTSVYVNELLTIDRAHKKYKQL